MAKIFEADDIDFEHYLKETEAHEKVRSAGVFAEDVIEYFWSKRGPIGAVLPWMKTQENMRFRPGEVTLWGGMNGHGKSLVIGQMCLGFLTQAEKVCIASFEMRSVTTLARICRQASGCAKPAPEEIRGFHEATRYTFTINSALLNLSKYWLLPGSVLTSSALIIT